MNRIIILTKQSNILDQSATKMGKLLHRGKIIKQSLRGCKQITKSTSRLSQGSRSEPTLSRNVKQEQIFQEESSNNSKSFGEINGVFNEDRKSTSIKLEAEQQIDLDLYIPLSQLSINSKNSARFQENKPIIFSKYFQNIDEIDFRILADSINRSKVHALMLMDKTGRVIFSDKLGHQLFEGSLNNFENVKLQNLILKKLESNILRELETFQNYDENSIQNWVIYSKNTKRRYSKVPFTSKQENLDIFYRFLKGLTIRFRPIRLFIQNYQNIQGFWNQHLVQRGIPVQCFMLEVKLSSKMPQLSQNQLLKDKTLAKYIQVNSKKALRWASSTIYEIVEESQIDSLHNQVSLRESAKSSQRQMENLDLNMSSQLSRSSQFKSFKSQGKQYVEELRKKRQSKGVKLITDIFIDEQ